MLRTPVDNGPSQNSADFFICTLRGVPAGGNESDERDRVRSGRLLSQWLVKYLNTTTAQQNGVLWMLKHRFPLSAKYHRDWMTENAFGANPLWLAEWLCQDMGLRPGMRVLDMGCGRVKSC